MIKRRALFTSFAAILLAGLPGFADWSTHTIRQINGKTGLISTPAQLQIVTESWNQVTAVPYIVYMPEKDRILMLIAYQYPHEAAILSSDDHGATWSSPRFAHTDQAGKSDVGMGVGLVYLGEGKVLFFGAGKKSNQEGGAVWCSLDYGQTWEGPFDIGLAPNQQPWHTWDPPLVIRDAKTHTVTSLLSTRYTVKPAEHAASGNDYHSQTYLLHSEDLGKTWSAGLSVPQWDGMNEITICRARNGDLVAACRTDKPRRFKDEIDHYEGLGISISQDQGQTWSEVKRLYEYGRHHPSLLLMPNGDLLMTYVVRVGYVNTPDGFPQFGIEAVISRDDGRSWDLDHRYMLHVWKGHIPITDSNSWWPSSQSTSTVQLPNGSILTAFGTGYRSQGGTVGPRDIGLVHWDIKPTTALDSDHTVSDAPIDSATRNLCDPAAGKPAGQMTGEKLPGKK